LTFYHNSCYVFSHNNCYDIFFVALMEFVMIRPTIPADTNALMALAAASGLFEPSQTAELAEMLGQHFAGDSPDYWLTDEDQEPVGVAYVAPERMTEGTWNLYLIAVCPDRLWRKRSYRQRQGRGQKLLEHVEQLLIDRGERVLLVETAGLRILSMCGLFIARAVTPRKQGFVIFIWRVLTRLFT
jgi:Acetyltransferase (GNAT) family